MKGPRRRFSADKPAERIDPLAGRDDPALPPRIRHAIRSIAFQARVQRSAQDFAFGRKRSRTDGVTVLFAGPSGTGKTLAAQAIAGDLGRDLLRVDLTGVVSRYIGETEKNLARIFDRAEAAGAVLFFDEADALFGRRTMVRSGHDRYANQEVGYLLQRLESFKGVAILATNRKASVDPAFLRRLACAIEFPLPEGVTPSRI